MLCVLLVLVVMAITLGDVVLVWFVLCHGCVMCGTDYGTDIVVVVVRFCVDGVCDVDVTVNVDDDGGDGCFGVDCDACVGVGGVHVCLCVWDCVCRCVAVCERVFVCVCDVLL